MRAFRSSLLVAFSFVLFSATAQAQYFGRNKVQWEKFDFKTLRTEHFDIYYYEQEADVVHDVGRMAERWYARLSRVFNHTFERKPIVLYANSADFHQTTTTGGLIGEGTGGFTDAFMNRVVLPLTGDYAQNDHVLGHEIVHVFQYDIAASAAQNRRRFNLEQLPLWLVEGMAEYFSKGRIDPMTSMWIRDATVHDRLPDLRKLSRDPRYFPYRYGQALMAYIGARFGDDAVVRYFMAAGSVGVDQAFERAVGLSSKQLFADWNEAARELYNPVITGRTDIGRPLIGRDPVPGKKSRRAGELNVGPALSPDGKYLAFLSARELFSIDLFLADARTGKVIRHLVSGDRNAHFESLRFIESAGSFGPDGRRLAFITFAQGDNQLSIVDVETRNIDNIDVPGIKAITAVAWSPDGRTIAISGQMTGVSDLFLYDLNTNEMRRLTNDKFADLQPAFSPDGRTIAFVTDRGDSSEVDQLQFSEKNLATIDVQTGQVRVLNLFGGTTKHINPQWSPDGRSLYFIANPEGIPDIYRYQFGDGTVGQLTSVQTGVAGITDMAPALTVATRTGDIAFSLFEDDNYNIYTLPAAAPVKTASLQTPGGIPRAAVLPPLRAAGSEITAYLNRPEQGLPPANATFERREYDANLRLAYLGPPTVGAVTGGGYNAIGGTVAAYFSDILGQHNVGVAFQGAGYGTSSIADQLAGEILYLNQKSRFNWGGDFAHYPYISVGYRAFDDTVPINGQPTDVIVYEELREILSFTSAKGIAQYPFSSTRRVEATGGYERFAYKAESELWFVDFNGNVLAREVVRHPGGFSLNYWQTGAAFVGDSSTYGFISPVRGTRYRHELSGLRGDLNFETALSDWRRYFYRRPVTLAVRGLYYGRYGEDAENDRLRPLYLGYFAGGSLVRAYEPWTVDPIECGIGSENVCNRLLGSHVAAASVEVRAPLFGIPEYGLITASFLPTEIFAFADIGAAWTEDNSVTWKWATNTNERVPVASYGAGLRMLLSYIPIEFYVAKPLHRPQEELVYGFNIIPGW